MSGAEGHTSDGGFSRSEILFTGRQTDRQQRNKNRSEQSREATPPPRVRQTQTGREPTRNRLREERIGRVVPFHGPFQSETADPIRVLRVPDLDPAPLLVVFTGFRDHWSFQIHFPVFEILWGRVDCQFPSLKEISEVSTLDTDPITRTCTDVRDLITDRDHGDHPIDSILEIFRTDGCEPAHRLKMLRTVDNVGKRNEKGNDRVRTGFLGGRG